MNEEIYFKQYRLLNADATDYVVLDIKEPYLDFSEETVVTRTIESYEENNEELPLVGEFAVLTNLKGLPVAIGKIIQVKVVSPNVEIKVKVVFV